MAFSSILSLVLIQAVLYSTTASAATTASPEKTISILFSKAPAVNSTDDYLLPISIGADSQLIYLTPSTTSDDTFVNSPKVCTPPGNKTVVDSCVTYRGGVFQPPLSSSWVPGSSGFSWKDEQYVLFADGNRGEDTLTVSGSGGKVTVEGFGFGLVDACNMTSAFVGLGRNSTLLASLVADGAIGGNSYGLHVGVDIVDHAGGVFDPTFDDGVGGPGSVEYNSGNSRRDVGNGTTVHSFPGSLTLGGYDKSKIDNRTATLKASIAGDGSLGLEVTKIVLLNVGGANDLLNVSRKVIIDSSTPYIYLPELMAQQLSAAVGAQGGVPGVDFFYGASADKLIGNVTFTLQLPGGGSSIDIVLPPSVLYQPISALRDYIPVGNANYDYYLPIKTFADSSNQPIILGRTFLKAAYLFVNHDTSKFQLSQAAYTRSPPNVVAVTSTDLTLDDTPSAPPSKHPLQAPATHDGPPIVPIAVAVGAGAVMFAFALAFLFWRRRQAASQTALAPIPSSATVNQYGNEPSNQYSSEPGTQMVELPVRDRDEKNPNGPGDWGVWEKDGNGGYYTPHPLAAGGVQYHEMESDYVGMATSPSQAYSPGFVELPAEPRQVYMQHPAFAGRAEQGPYTQHGGAGPEVRYEMM